MTHPEGYTTWQAIHADCAPHANCCVSIPDITVTPQIQRAATALGMSVEAFLHMAVARALRTKTDG